MTQSNLGGGVGTGAAGVMETFFNRTLNGNHKLVCELMLRLPRKTTTTTENNT